MSASMLELDSDQESYNYVETLGKQARDWINWMTTIHAQPTLFLQTPLQDTHLGKKDT